MKDELKAPAEAPAEAPVEAPAEAHAKTIAETIVNSGLSKEDIKNVFRECLQEMEKKEPSVNVEEANKNYFGGLFI